MKAFKHRTLLWEFIGALDSGAYDDLNIDDVRRHANAGTIHAFIVDRFPDFDLSAFDGRDWKHLAQTWANIANAVDSRRKFGFRNSGLALLMAYALETTQMLERAERAERGKRRQPRA
jgi:hypothetical protein